MKTFLLGSLAVLLVGLMCNHAAKSQEQDTVVSRCIRRCKPGSKLSRIFTMLDMVIKGSFEPWNPRGPPR